MSESSGSTVECPLCGEDFDPTAAGGWCTNSECGEWQYDGDDVGATPVEHQSEAGVPFGDDAPGDERDDADPVEASTDDGGTDAPSTTAGGDAADDHEAPPADTAGDDDATATGASEPAAATEATEDESVDATAESAAEPTDAGSQAEQATEADESRADDPADAEAAVEAEEPDATTESEQPDAATESEDADVAAEPEEPDAAAEPEDDGAATEAEDADAAAGADAEDTTEEPAEVDCPSCETTLDADANFCPSCGADVSDVEPGADELTECPGCGTDVDPDDNFCATCGHDLTDVSAADEEEAGLTECPSCGADVEDDDSFCVSCGEDLEAHRGDDASEPAPDAGAAGSGAGESARPAPSELVLSLRGQEVRVSDGQKVGREIRRIITESGGDKDDAVRVHREHVRFVREGDQFYVIDLGENPTTLNGQPMERGDRKPVDPGDEIGLSGVVSIDVNRP